MKYNKIDVSKQNKIVTVFLNRPDIHNAMDEQLIKELTDCFKKLDKEKTTRIIVLTGKGKSFCAGADLNWMKSMIKYSKSENIKDSNILLDLYETIYNCSKPVIAKVNGNAFGGGIGLFAVCDITIAISGCNFAFSEIKLGIIPAVISRYISKRLKLLDMRRLFITGERFDSNYAKEIGLIDIIASEKEIDNIVKKYIDILWYSSPNAINEVKKLINTYEKLDSESYKKFTVEKISELRVSEEGQEGINAFLNKRKNKWSE